MTKALKQKNYKFGLFAEFIASLYLKCKLYNVIARRYKSPFGEIDLIAVKSQQLIFVEVKARRDINIVDFISIKQQKRITRAAEYFLLKEQRYQNHYLRFDIIVINRYLIPHHIKNYW
jgi:putative endonuclease